MSAANLSNAQTEIQEVIRNMAEERSRRRSKQRSKDAIRSFINKFIKQRQSRNRCNLTNAEIVLFALACSPDEWLLTAQIGEFAMSNSRFFQRESAQFFFGRPGYYAPPLSLSKLVWDTDTYLRTYGIPVHSKMENNQKFYSMTAGSAYALMEAYKNKSMVVHATTGKKSTSCPLLMIPVELRMKIYSLVLKVSGFRLLVGNESFSVYNEDTPIWDSRAQDALLMPPIADFLALLSVNKQIHNEAMPEFYHENHFQFRDMGAMKRFLINIGTERRKHMRHVSVRYDNLSAAAAAAKLLTESESLQKLTLTIAATQDAAGHFTVNSSRRKFSTLTQVPGFTAMKRLRGVQQLTFNPRLEHTVVDAFLRPIITQPKSTRVVRKTKKIAKRKSDSDHESSTAKKSKSD
ncbi:hypothetical protein E4T48_02336 [Aureobasidium sp. EXF-10727]|nr:hypothetical protein E4T48_02336 [Aureobasidium sp. EXF-10727]